MVVRGVDYDGRLALSYNAGRVLLPDAEHSWARTVAPYLEPGALVADVGAGTGRFTDLFAKTFPVRVIAIEPARGMRSQRDLVPSADPVWVGGKAEALPIRGGVVDLAWLSCIVHYLDLVSAGAELARVLRPDGRVLVRSVFPDRFDDLLWMHWFPAARAIDEARMPSVEAVAGAFGAAGLRLEERHAAHQLVANDLGELAERLSHRAISTLELISDEDFEHGLETLRADAARQPAAPVYSTVDTLVFAPDHSSTQKHASQSRRT